MGLITERKVRQYSGLAADRTSIPAGGKSVGDHFFATDIGVLYIWDGSAWVSVSPVVPVGLSIPRYCAAWDFQDFYPAPGITVDGLNLSAIIPVGAIAVDLRFQVFTQTVGQMCEIRVNGTTGAENKLHVMILTVENADQEVHGIIPIDADRLLDLNCSAIPTWCGLAIGGWII